MISSFARQAHSVPTAFQPRMPFNYPPDSELEFEYWYFMNKTGIVSDRVYLPVMWTAYYVKHRISKVTVPSNIILDGPSFSTVPFKELQKFLDELDPSTKYYTIVQHDDGILHDLSHLDIFVMGMGAKSDYTLPLIAQPHKWKFDNRKEYLASWVGMITHPIRQEICTRFGNDRDMVISGGRTSLHSFCDIMSRSIFALCPRGYGATSFRIQESLQYGAIPIYISDEFLEPYDADFNLYGHKVRFDELTNLKHLLGNLTHTARDQVTVDTFKSLFTYEGCADMIEHKLKSVI